MVNYMKNQTQIGVSSKAFPRLKKESGLLIVTGMKVFHMYHLHQGTLKLIESLSQNVGDTDRQKGRFEHRANGKMIGSGAVTNQSVKEDQRHFLERVSKAISTIRIRYNKVFLFTPPRFSAALQAALPEKMRAKITREISGNYTKEHETELLAIIQEERTEDKRRHAVTPQRKEVTKLLKPKPTDS